MKEVNETVYICEGCGKKYSEMENCVICEQADPIIDALSSIDSKISEWYDKDCSLDVKRKLISKLKPVFESLWGSEQLTKT